MCGKEMTCLSIERNSQICCNLKRLYMIVHSRIQNVHRPLLQRRMLPDPTALRSQRLLRKDIISRCLMVVIDEATLHSFYDDLSPFADPDNHRHFFRQRQSIDLPGGVASRHHVIA